MPITQKFLNSAAQVSFADAAAIDSFFTRQNMHDFIGWFNANVANKGFWGKSGSRAGISMATDSKAHDRFNELWNSESIKTIFGKNSVSLLQFLSLQSIVNNETGGSLIPLTEGVGNAANPGIAYAFNKIKNLKRSYNTLAGNKTCFDLFNDSNYNNSFQNLALGSQLKNTTDAVWKGEAYPQAVATSTKPAITGYVLEADFFKFRGRGFIQTTGRTNYAGIIDFVMKYAGSNPVILNMKTEWAKRSANIDVLATVSTNSEWDNLFQNSDLLIAARSVEVHNAASGDYLGKLTATDPTAAANTIRTMGKRISGGDTYAALFLNRVTQIIELL